MCRVSGGATGTRMAALKFKGTVQYFETKAQAQKRADEMKQKMNNEYSVARFEYWPEEKKL